MDNPKKILIIDDDREVSDLLEMTLSKDGYSLIRTGNGLIGYKLAKTHLPDLIIMDVVMPGMDGMTLCQKLRQDNHLRLVPIIILTGSRTRPNDKIAGLSVGADDYILKPFVPQELSARVKRLLKRTEEHMSVNPLTKLPGSVTLESEVVKLIESKTVFSLCYFDIDHFKAFNDSYSYREGDRVIRFLAGLISDVVYRLGNETDMVAHIGGDDFIVLTTPDKAQTIYDEVNKCFSLEMVKYYNREDMENGYVATTNRKGVHENFPIMTISAAAASNQQREISHYGQIVDILSELKKYAKMHQGQVFINDRRHN
jgi:diguanylate cyclase (GGDEF)-like protein